LSQVPFAAGDNMETIAATSLEIELDDAGLLVDPQAWTADIARDMAQQLGIGELTEDHWLVIRDLRRHFEQHGVVPAMNNICRPHGKDWHWTHDLFHTCLNAWRVAGLPDPGEEAKSYLSGM
jgi:TusE/DsrC/DsvC family sulfur relay protein